MPHGYNTQPFSTLLDPEGSLSATTVVLVLLVLLLLVVTRIR